jgi:hypothetical protein
LLVDQYCWWTSTAGGPVLLVDQYYLLWWTSTAGGPVLLVDQYVLLVDQYCWWTSTAGGPVLLVMIRVVTLINGMTIG